MRSSSPQEILQAIFKELAQPARSVQEMPHRVELCLRALPLVNRLQQPNLWGALQIEIGDSLAQNPQDNRAENLEQAIHHFQQALEIKHAPPSRLTIARHNAIWAIYCLVNGAGRKL